MLPKPKSSALRRLLSGKQFLQAFLYKMLRGERLHSGAHINGRYCMNMILCTLGAPNDDDGNLSPIAKDRLNCTYALYSANPTAAIICTGGFGEHFNRTPHPHSYYAKRFLVKKGIPANAFLESPLSANTVEDFTFSKPIISDTSPDLLVLITSDFHMPRARFLFEKIIRYPKTLFVPVQSTLKKSEMKALRAHEERALTELKTQGLRI